MSEPIVDGAAVYVATGDTDRIEKVYRDVGLEPFVLDGPTGDGTEEMVAVGSIDGDEPIELAIFLDVLDRLDGEYISADVLAAGELYDDAKAYIIERGYNVSRPIRAEHSDDITGFTPGIEISTQY